MSHVIGVRPCHRGIIGIDVEGSTRLTDPAKAALRRTMYDLFEQALSAGGLIGPYRDPFLDRGDGVLALIRPVDQAPKTLLLDTVVPTLGTLLAEHNRSHPSRRFRLRAVVHAGEVTHDEKGCFGESLDVAFRLLEAEPLKQILDSAGAPMVLVISDEIHRSVVRHGYEGIDPRAFHRLLLPRGSLARSAWVRLVGGTGSRSVTSIGDHRRRA